MTYDVTCIPEQVDQSTPPEPWELEPEFPPLTDDWIALADRTGWTPSLVRAVARDRCTNLDCIQGWVQSGYSYRRCHICGGTGRRPADE